jgi:hypothetical protein
MTDLDEQVYGVLEGMPVLPLAVGHAVLGRLSRIERAIEDDVMDEGTILIQFRDCAGDMVVLAMTIGPRTAFLDVSTSEDAIAISNGYTFRMGERGVRLAVDRGHRLTPVDHGELVGRWIATERMLGMLGEARALMRTHPVFERMI